MYKFIWVALKFEVGERKLFHFYQCAGFYVYEEKKHHLMLLMEDAVQFTNSLLAVFTPLMGLIRKNGICLKPDLPTI